MDYYGFARVRVQDLGAGDVDPGHEGAACVQAAGATDAGTGEVFVFFDGAGGGAGDKAVELRNGSLCVVCAEYEEGDASAVA